MRIDFGRVLVMSLMLLMVFIGLPPYAVEPYGPADAQITIVAMDPMAAPVPFVSAFVDSSLSPEVRRSITSALLSMNESPDMLKAMETKLGFLPYEVAESAQEKKSGQAVR